MNSENKKTKNDCYSPGNNVKIPQRNRKPRLKWTKELHQHFVRAVNQLGGACDATPKNIVKLMGVQEITPNHIKSHLQKYRHSKELYGIDTTKAAENGMTLMPYEAYQGNKYSTILPWQTHKYTQMHKAQKLSTEGQRNCKTQSEKSENFQQQVPCSQEKNLIAVLERIPETIKEDDKHSEEAKSKKNQLYEPVTYQTQIHSLHSCLTFSRVTEKNQDIYHLGAEAESDTWVELKEIEKKNKLKKDDIMWLAAIKKDRPLCCSLRDGDGNVEEVEAKRKPANDCTISIGLQFTKANTSRFLKGGPKTTVEYYDNFCDLERFSAEVDTLGATNKSKVTSFTENGPLYSSGESNSALNYQPFDLNVPVLDEQLRKEQGSSK